MGGDGHCRSCGAPVLWRTHARTGKPAPIDAAPDPAGNVVLVGAGHDRIAGTGDGGEEKRTEPLCDVQARGGVEATRRIVAMAKKKTESPTLPTELRAVLEKHRVIDPAPVPDLADLVAAVRRMGGAAVVWSLGMDAYEARVEMDGEVFDAAADDPALALAQAFASALTATFPLQGGLFAGDAGASFADGVVAGAGR